MDDKELERIASNNPAMTMPAAARVYSRSYPQKQSISQQSTSIQRTHSAGIPTETASDPAGDSTQIRDDTLDQDLDKYDRGWRHVVRNFSPSWFAVTMGTGVSSLILITIPWKAAWLYWLSVAFFGLNTILFTAAFAISFLRYTLYPEIWTVMINDPTNSLFLGCAPIGFATLIESWIFLCVPYWGTWAATFAWILWMIDSIAAFAITVGLSYMLMSQSHIQALDRITAAQLLPIAATIVAAGTGAEAAEVLPNSDHAIGTIITSYVLWAMSTPLAMVILVIYYQRLAVHKLPPREIIVSSFLPLGPLGMGGYTIMYLGRVTREVLPRVRLLQGIPVAGDIFYVLGIFIALIMWGFGLTWLCFALVTIWRSRPFPFNMGWWGFTFPLGVFAISTMTMGAEMPSLAFKVLGTIFGIAVILLWMVVFVGTARGAWNGKLFYAPCLRNLPKEESEMKQKLTTQEKDLEKSS